MTNPASNKFETLDEQKKAWANRGFKYTVSLTRVSDGTTVVFQEDWGYPQYVRDDEWESNPVFIWTEGNYSCNCNRFLFYWRALGKTEDQIHELDPDKNEQIGSCGLYEKFHLNWIRNNETGKVIYNDEYPC